MNYEISLWEDFQNVYQPVGGDAITYFDERKICVIGADTMDTQVRAIEPKFVENTNGTHTLTFKMCYKYVDEITSEEFTNPFLEYLINERKVKLKWKNEWYDLVIKKCQESTDGKSITYTCTDLFINELSKNGFELNFATDLENNIGTVKDLTTATLQGTTWQYDDEHSDQISQLTEEPVYEVQVSSSFSVTKQSPLGDSSAMIYSGSGILVFYSSVSAILDGFKGGEIPTTMQILYAPSYTTDANDVLVTNGDCYLIEGITSSYDSATAKLTILKNNTTIMNITVGEGVSSNYRAERLVKSPLQEYDNLVQRYVTVCKEVGTNRKVYLIEATEYTDPLAVVNLIANPSQFKNTSGWVSITGDGMQWRIYPEFDKNTSIATYTAKSYLCINGTAYNTALTSNISYLTPTSGEIRNGNIGGFQEGEKYIFRYKAVQDSGGLPSNTHITTNVVNFSITDINNPTSTSRFYLDSVALNGDWVEQTLICQTPCSVDSIKNLGLFLTTNGAYWFEDIQFFKYSEGIANYSQQSVTSRMNPGEIGLQSIAEKRYKYFYADHNGATSVKDLTFIYIGKNQNNNYPIQYNNYEKIATITIKESNRFNILQTIAETFKCWARFRIEHDNMGKVVFIQGKPQKFVTFVAEIGEDNGICFEYGIDLKSIQRNIDSDQLATKVIVIENSNEFAKDGFCTIARSSQNYSKANFLLNFDYYIQQGLLPSRQIEKDLYGTSDNDIGYFYNLRWLNRDYDGLSEELTTKRMDLLKANSQLITYRQYRVSANEKIDDIKDDIMKLANVTTWAAAQDYVSSHTNNTKVQTLMNSYAETNNLISYYDGLISQAEGTINTLNGRITTLTNQIENILSALDALNLKFNEKYGNYIQEGTWNDESYSDDDQYYLDAVNVSYTSSKPQITYAINVLRLSSLEEFSSKVFNVGEICYMVDIDYFGYANIETKTPYKEKILVNEIASYLDQPEKDVITVKNYYTRFDDLFHRMAAATQSLQYAEGGYSRAAGAVNTNRTLSFSMLQDTFDQNLELVLNASNQDVVWDETGITVTNKSNPADKTKIIAGGIFVTNDGGLTWKNAVRGDGISTELLTAGRINTSEIFVYDGNHPTFRWDSDGLTAYFHDHEGSNFNKFVRHDRFGLYGYDNKNFEALTDDFLPNSEEQIWDNENIKFALTWNGFLFNSSTTDGYLRIASSENSVPVKAEEFLLSKDYYINDLCIYEDSEYVFISNHNAGEWNPSQVALTGYTIFNENSSYANGDLVYYNGYRYRFINPHSGIWDFDDVELISMKVFTVEDSYSRGDIVEYNNSHYMFRQDHEAGAWTGNDVQQVTVADYMLIYGGTRVNGNVNTPKFYITQNGNAFFNGAIFTNGSITGSSLRIGGTRDNPAFQVDNDGTLVLRTYEGVDMRDCVYFDPQRGNYVFDGLLGADAIFTDSLYAEQGDIAELTVDRLSTSKRIRKYILGDTSDENYITIQDQSIKWVTGTIISTTNVLTEEELPILTELGVPITVETGNAATEHVLNRYGQALYWQKEPVDHTDEGYPLDEDGMQIYVTTDVTDWPVLAYQYTQLVKSEYSFSLWQSQIQNENNSQVYVPQIVLGAGDENGRSKGYIYKDDLNLVLRYVTRNNQNVDIKFGDDGFVDAKHRRLSSCNIDTVNGTVAYTVEGSNEIHSLSFIVDGNTVTYIWNDGHTCTITIPGGE